jgi:hypothetical protein
MNLPDDTDDTGDNDNDDAAFGGHTFGGQHSVDDASEAAWRWGDTDAFQESKRRARQYTPADWVRLKREGKALLEALGAAKRRGVQPTDDDAVHLAELNRRFNSDWFYETDHAFHVRLADMYMADPRFQATYDAIEPGLAAWYAAAIHENARRHGVTATVDDSALETLRQSLGLLPAPSAVFPADKEQRRAQQQNQRHDQPRPAAASKRRR